jgi:DNA-binding response OmpR family regulator/ribosomal protein S27E
VRTLPTRARKTRVGQIAATLLAANQIALMRPSTGSSAQSSGLHPRTRQVEDSRPASPQGHGLLRSVLLVDAPEITGPVAAFLRSAGMVVYEASNGGQARGLISRYRPDCVILEVLLPLETGFELCAFIKKADGRIPVLMLTEVRLDESRNLAMWSGADAYLTKPTMPDLLLDRMRTAAIRVSERIRRAEAHGAGLISYRCGCGHTLKVPAKNAGRAIPCPACKHLARCPDSLLDSSTLFRSLAESRRGVRSSRTGITCPDCHWTVDPRRCRVRDHFECPKCQKRLALTDELLEEWPLFFGDAAEEVVVSEFNPLRYVFVKCDGCRNLHSYFDAHEVPQACPVCGHLHTLPSIRGVPVSRAALESTGRLFEFRLTGGRRKLFLLPPSRKWLVGSSPECPIALTGQPLEPRHALLRQSPGGPVLMPVSPQAATYVNGQLVTDRLCLQAGDSIRLGGVDLLLLGTPPADLRKMSSVLDDVLRREKQVGELELSEPAARILQSHWELQRLRLQEASTPNADAMASAESSIVQRFRPPTLADMA